MTTEILDLTEQETQHILTLRALRNPTPGLDAELTLVGAIAELLDGETVSFAYQVLDNVRERIDCTSVFSTQSELYQDGLKSLEWSLVKR